MSCQLPNPRQSHTCAPQAFKTAKGASKVAATVYIFVGVLTETKMMPASLMAASTSVEKKRFLPLARKTISSRPAMTSGKGAGRAHVPYVAY